MPASSGLFSAPANRGPTYPARSTPALIAIIAGKRILKRVSEATVSWHEAHRNERDRNLEHFLTGASYQEALYLETGTRRPCAEDYHPTNTPRNLSVQCFQGFASEGEP